MEYLNTDHSLNWPGIGQVSYIRKRIAEIRQLLAEYEDEAEISAVAPEQLLFAAENAERLTSSLRHAILCDDGQHFSARDAIFLARRRDAVIVKNSGVKAFLNNEKNLVFRLPPLISRRSPKTYSPYLEQAVYSALRELLSVLPEDVKLVTEPYIVCVCRIYTTKSNPLYIPDNDNIEASSIVNAVGQQLMLSDKYDAASFYYTSRKGDVDCSEISFISLPNQSREAANIEVLRLKNKAFSPQSMV